jgi:hypothetical protein
MTKKLFKKGTYKSFKKMTLDVVSGKVKANKKVKGWIADIGSENVIGLLRRIFIRHPKTPKAAEMHVWNRIEKAQRKNHPIAYFLLYDVVFYFSVKKRRFMDFIWWFKYRLQKEHRYHVVNTGLEPGYHTEAEILLHSSMSVLVNHVENSWHGGDERGVLGLRSYITFLEKNLDPKTWPEWERKYGKKYIKQRIDTDSERLMSYKEILTLYTWWKYQRAVEHLSLEQEKNLFYDNRNFDNFPWDSTKAPVNPNKLKGKEKKLYNQEKKKLFDLYKRDDDLLKKDDKMLARLAGIRKHMW